MTPDQPKILIVEDEGIVAMDLRAALMEAGYQVPMTCASSGEAIKAARDEKPDLILMDIHIKGDLDGIDTARIVQAERPVPVVFLTAFADAETLRRANLVGPYGYLVKPYDEQTLKTTIEVTLSKAATDRDLVHERDLMAGLLGGLPEGILMVDHDGMILYANQQAADRFGATTGDLADVWPPGADLDVAELLARARTPGRFECRIDWPGGAETVTIEAVEKPLPGAVLVLASGAASGKVIDAFHSRLDDLI